MAIERLIESKYPRGLRFLFLNQRQRAAPQERLADRRVREIDLYANIPSWFEFAAKYENAQRPAYTIVRQMFLVQPKLPQTDELIKVADMILDDESQDRWLAHMLAGFANHRKAWDIRGRRQPGNSQEFMEKAAKHFLAAHELHPEYPDAAKMMIEVAMAGGDPNSTQYWFEKTIAAEIDNGEAYQAFLWSMRPRWGGSHELMMAFGKECLDSKRWGCPAGRRPTVLLAHPICRPLMEYLLSNEQYGFARTAAKVCEDIPRFGGCAQ